MYCVIYQLYSDINFKINYEDAWDTRWLTVATRLGRCYSNVWSCQKSAWIRCTIMGKAQEDSLWCNDYQGDTFWPSPASGGQQNSTHHSCDINRKTVRTAKCLPSQSWHNLNRNDYGKSKHIHQIQWIWRIQREPSEFDNSVNRRNAANHSDGMPPFVSFPI